MRRPTPDAATRPVLVLFPVPDLPAWHPAETREGFTPATALDAALEWAEQHVASPAQIRRLTSFAFRAIRVARPLVQRAYTVERLAGVDRLRDLFAASPAEDVDDELAPF